MHEKWVNIRTLLQTKLINILNIHTNPDFKFLDEWCAYQVRTKMPHEAALPVSYSEWSRAYQRTGVSLGYEALGPPVLVGKVPHTECGLRARGCAIGRPIGRRVPERGWNPTVCHRPPYRAACPRLPLL